MAGGASRGPICSGRQRGAVAGRGPHNTGPAGTLAPLSTTTHDPRMRLKGAGAGADTRAPPPAAAAPGTAAEHGGPCAPSSCPPWAQGKASQFTELCCSVR